MINHKPALSIIVPVLNEETGVRTHLARVRRIAPGAQILVVDGFSTDATYEIASDLVDQAFQAGPGRALQMNAGAAAATGEYLLFLHADTELPDNFSDLFKHWVVSSPAWGYFPVRLSGSGKAFRLIESMINLRTKLTHGATGDQCLVYRADVFKGAVGFPELPLMEDISMSRRMRRLFAPKVFSEPVITSSRRWERGGVLRTVLKMWLFRGMFSLGVHPRYFARLYPQSR